MKTQPSHHLIGVVSQRRQSALLCPSDHGCAVVAVLTLDHGVAKVAGATEVRPEITEPLDSTSDVRVWLEKDKKIKWLSVPGVGSVSKHAAPAL